MRKNYLCVLLIVVSIAFLMSCQLPDANKGVFCVENRSKDESFYISNVMVKTRNDSGYKSIFDGKILPKDSYYLTVDSGEYFVKITATTPLLNSSAIVVSKNYETGWKRIDSKNSPILIFDGEKIFFE